MGRRIATINGLTDWRLCVGCGACSFICPEHKIGLVDSVHEGIRPRAQDEKCGPCSLCLEVCPAWVNDHTALRSRPGAIPDLLPGFGPVLELYEGYARDPEIRHFGASGGAITALALFCLEQEKMYGVLHIGAAAEDPVRNRTRMSRCRAELLNCTGSRYSPASACDRLDLIESAPAPCVFIGKPSEVTALRKAQRLRPALDAKVGMTISFFCAGSPSTQGTLDLLRLQGIEPGELAELRYRGLGWPGMFAVRRSGQTNLQPLLTYKESWGILQKFRPWSSHLFPDGCGEDADIVCGDPWCRTPADGEAGRSLILIRTERGRQLLRAAEAAGYLEVQPSTPAHLLKSQENLLRKRGAIWGRIFAMRLFGLPTPKLRGFSLFRSWLILGRREKVRSIFGTMRRIVRRGFLRPNQITTHSLNHSTAGRPSHAPQRAAQVCIMGASLELGNRGVAALAASLVRLVSALNPNTHIMFLLGRSHSKPFMLATGNGAERYPVVNYRLTPTAPLREQLWWIVLLSAIYRAVPIRCLRTRILASGQWFRAVAGADWVGDIRGGDSFSDIYGMKRFLFASLAAISVIWIKGDIVLFPQTYGPFASRFARWLGSYILKRASAVLARDHTSVEVARSLGAKPSKVQFCPDVAFALESREPDRIVANPPLPSSTFRCPRPTALIGLNVSGLLLNGGYTRNNMFRLKMDYREFLVLLLQNLLGDRSNRVLFVPHTFAPPGSVESDPAACVGIRDFLPEPFRDRAYLITGEYDQSQIKAIIGHCDFFIGSRMHACIAALSQCIPAVGIAYSRKFHGVFDSVGAGDWVVDGRDLTPEQGVDRCVHLFSRRSEMRGLLAQTVPAAKLKLQRAFVEVQFTLSCRSARGLPDLHEHTRDCQLAS